MTPLSHPAPGSDFGPAHHLSPLWEERPTLSQWEDELRPALERRWREVIGHPAPGAWEPGARIVATWEGPEFRATLYRQASGEGYEQPVLLLRPLTLRETPAPCAVIPFYHPEAAAGFRPWREGEPLALEEENEENRVRRYGYDLVRKGYIVACVGAFPFYRIPEPKEKGGSFAWWQAAAEHLLSRNPNWTGIGKLMADTSLAIDLLLAQPDVDPSRLLAMGHSLGGKMAFYTAAFDPRVSTVIGSDFGLPWASTNWENLWYLGPRRPGPESDLAHHHLLALLAPRPFLLLAGETDTNAAWQYLEAARPVYSLYETSERLALHNHATGHPPTPASLQLAYRWLESEWSAAARSAK